MQTRKTVCYTAIVFFLTLLFYSLFINLMPITDPVESVYAESAREMYVSGQWVSPQLFDKPWYDKPPVIYWAISISFAIFGVSEFAARFPFALISAMMVTFSFIFSFIIRRDIRISIWTAVILATSLEFWFLGHLIITDMFLLVFNSLALLIVYWSIELNFKRNIGFLLAGLLTGLAILSKGPVGLLLPLVIIALYLITTKRLVHNIFCLIIMTIIALVVALPWFWAMWEMHGDTFLQVALGLHNVTRATVSEHPEDNVWYYYLMMFPAGIFPWTLIWLASIKKIIVDKFNRYLWVWIVVTIVFYSLMATKYPTYAFIAQVPACILAAMFLCEEMRGKYSRLICLQLPIIALMIVLALVGIKLEHVNILPLVCSGGVLLIINVFGFIFCSRQSLSISVISLVLVMLGAIYFYAIPYCDFRSAKQVLPMVDSAKNIAIVGDYATSLVFYTKDNIWQLSENSVMRREGAWAGKYTMPENALPEFNLLDGKKIIVVNGENKHWLQLLTREDYKTVGITDDFTVLAK